MIDPVSSFLLQKKLLSLWIGVAHNVGAPLCSWVLTYTCIPMARSSVLPFSEEDLMNPEVTMQIAALDAKIREKIGGDRTDQQVKEAVGVAAPIIPDTSFLTMKEEEQGETDSCEEDHIQDVDGRTPDSLDKYILAEVLLSHGGDLVRKKLPIRNGITTGLPEDCLVSQSHKEPILDSRQYDVVFEDGSTNTFTANVIAESMYAQIDDEGHHFTIMDAIIDQKSDSSAVKKDISFTF
jgi:hypothetical protein